MTISNRIRRIIAAILLTAVIIIDAFQIGTIANSQKDISQAYYIPWPRFYQGKKVYHPDGTFKGCEIPGNECVIIAVAGAELTISSEGLAVQ